MAAQIQEELCGTANPPLIEELQVVGGMWGNPSTPSIDILNGDDFVVDLAYGLGNIEFNFLVRARVSTVDDEGGQDLLDSMMDPRAATSVALAILGDRTLGGVVEDCAVIEQSGYALFPIPADPEGGSYIGATWTVRVTP